MRRYSIPTLALLVILSAWPAYADWDETMPSKWVQFPDLDLTGIDVNCSSNATGEPGYILADDFLCTETGPITEVHIWGSWLQDMLPGGDPHNVGFLLSIHADIPAGVVAEHSMPGEELWLHYVQPHDFVARPYAENIAEGWLNPPYGYIPPPADTVCWQYNFNIPEDAAFVQEGTTDQPIVYWLNVQAFPQESPNEVRFGWKTSVDHWNDDAVWVIGSEPYNGFWNKLGYYFNHPFEGQPMDLAFVLNGPTIEPTLDFGDAPDMNYRTLLASDGPRHALTQLFMGMYIDGEYDGQPTPGADGDDLDSFINDEDGVTFGPLVPYTIATVQVTVSMDAKLDAWIDFSGNGTFADAIDQIFAGQPVYAGTNSLNFPVPYVAGVAGMSTFARFRVSTDGGLNYYGVDVNGNVPDGEVEDYNIWIDEPQPEMDFGDCPDQPYPTLLANNGPRHMLDILYLGNTVDPEPDGQPDATATGDDLDMAVNDEDGVTFGPIVIGTVANVQVLSSNFGLLDAWIDFDGNGNFSDSYDQIFASQPVVPGINPLTYTVPNSAGSVTARTFARFRVSNGGGLSYDGIYPTGTVPVGEVEDYMVYIEQPEMFDFGDAPDPTYPTLIASNGPQHMLSNLFMGLTVDGEFDGQPSPTALRDDNNGIPDDEDGVIFGPLNVGQPATVQVTSSGFGRIDAWVDFDGDGTWTQANEYVIVSQPAGPGPNTFTFNVPMTAMGNATTYARVRLSSGGNLSFAGPYPDGTLPDGEVEDYTVYIEDDMVYKWIQEPDLSIYGIDVNATHPYVLADDFLCDRRGPLTDIWVWGSWDRDYYPFGEDPGMVDFILSIHKDIPAGQQAEYSMPGDVLWLMDFPAHEFEVEMYAQGEEGWMDPPDAYYFPADWTCWLYKFKVQPHLAFEQRGTPDEPIVYWLDVQAFPHDPDARFGWKTSFEHWNDDATWGMGEEPYFGPWGELIYPPNHELWGQSIDLAFALFQDQYSAMPERPTETGLLYNSPNPFNPMTEIYYAMPEGGGVIRLEIYDAMGRRVTTLVDGFVDAGRKSVTWTGKDDRGADVPSGVYFYRIRGAGMDQSLKMLLLR